VRGRFKYIAFYDLDHTILVVNSATQLVEEARSRGIMSEKQFRHALYLSVIYKLGLGNPSKMIIRMLSWLNGLKLATVEELCAEVFRDSLVQTIRPEILDAMAHHSSCEGANVLLSSATTPICQPVTDHLALDDMICTRLESNNGYLTGTPVGNLVYGMEKKNRLLSYCENHGFDPSEAYYYGDSYTDHHVMECVGKPVAVAPDRKLLKIALKNNWPILVKDR
jgi:HAD superfamily hydrolase (TIGR01490 family)